MIVDKIIVKITIALLIILTLFGGGIFSGYQWCRAKYAGVDAKQLREDGKKIEALKKEDTHARIKIVDRIKKIPVDNCWTRPVPAGTDKLLRE